MGCRVLHAALSLVFTLATLKPATAQTTLPTADVLEEALRLPVAIGGQDYALDVMIVRRAGTDKLPVALITHGANPGNPRGATTDWLRGWAHDLAHRGWLAVAAMRSVARQPDADMDHVLAIGDSSGGAAVMALAARKSVPLGAVVNVSGGLAYDHQPFQHDLACAAYESDLVWNFARFGVSAHMPTLWLYAENDSWFRPGLVSRMQAAFTGSGGRAQLAMLPPFQGDGHTVFSAAGGRRLLLPELDGFLRAQGLPAWDAAPFKPLLTRLSPADRPGMQEYLRQPTEKALALGPAGGLYWWEGSDTLDDARAQALAYCKRKAGAGCTLAAEDFRPLDPPTKPEQEHEP